MKIGGGKNTSTVDIYLRLSGVDKKGATECLGFTPDSCNFGDNVISIFNKGKLMEISNPTQIENMIYVVRGQKVMLDSDLAEL
jgi:hypothetical protein